MKIDLSNLASPKNEIVPVKDNSFQFHKKKYHIEVNNGWWLVSIQGNKATPVEQYYFVGDEKKFSLVSGYTYGNQIIFKNFDVSRRNWGLNLSAPLHFNSSDTFSSIKAVVWENGQFFYAFQDYSDLKIFDVKMAYGNEQSLEGLKGITPELRTLYLFHEFERNQLKEMLKQKAEAEEHEKMMQEIPYRLKITLERAGASLIGYSQSGDRLIVDWTLQGGSHQYNSVIDSKTWMVRECGFCCSSDDQRHNLTSMIKTAEIYEEQDVIFITRH